MNATKTILLCAAVAAVAGCATTPTARPRPVPSAGSPAEPVAKPASAHAQPVLVRNKKYNLYDGKGKSLGAVWYDEWTTPDGTVVRRTETCRAAPAETDGTAAPPPRRSSVTEAELAASPVARLAKAIEDGDAATVAKHVDYPLARKTPLPSIADEQEFVARFPVLFDEAFRDRMRNGSFSNDWDEVGWRGTMFGNGDIWIDGTIQGGGKIAGVNYESAAERKQRGALVEAERETLHESLADFCDPMHCFVTEDGRTAGRIDALDDGPQFVRVALFDTPVRRGAKPSAVFRARNTGGGNGGCGGNVFPDENGRWLVEMCGVIPSFITPVFLLCERNPLSGEPPRGRPATPAKWEAILSNAPVRDEQRLDEMGPRCDVPPADAELLDENGACAVFAGETAEDAAFNEELRKGDSESPALRNSLFYRWKGPDGTEDWRLLLTTGLDGVSTYDERDIRNPDHLRELKACFNVVTAEFSRTGCGIRLTCDPNEDGHTVNCWLDLYSDGKQLRLVDDWSSEEKHFDDDVLHWLAPEEEKQKAAPDVETDPDNTEEVLKSLGL